MATKTIGYTSAGAAGDYTTFAAWVAYLNGLGTLSAPEVGELMNGTNAGGLPGAMTPFTTMLDLNTGGGLVTSPTNTVTVRPAAGYGWRDKSGAASNPLRYDPANGAAIAMATAYDECIRASVGNVIVIGLQLAATGAPSRAFLGGVGGTGCRVDSCLIRVTQAGAIRVDDTGQTIKNNVIINALATPGTTPMIRVGGSSTVDNNTIVRPSFLTAAGIGVQAYYGGTVTARNNAVFGHTTPFNGIDGTGVYHASSDYNATDRTAVGTAQGTHNLVSLTYADQFEDVGSGSGWATTVDWRPKSTGALLNAGTATGTPSTDILGQSRSGAHDVGAWEYQAAADSTPPTLSSPAIPSAGTTLTATLSESGCTPASGTGGFTLAGTSATVTSWAISGTTLTLTLSGTVYAGQTVTLSYARASTTDDIHDAASNFLADSSAAAVTNNSTQVAPPAAGTASFVGSGTAGISASATAPTGGSGSGPTYQWERNAGGGSYSDLSGATSLSLTDATASAGTLYGYRCKQTRGSDTVTTNAVTAQVYAGGPLAGGTSTDPGVANVRSGTAYTIDDVGLTGTFVVPTEAQVEDGVDYGAGGTEFTGTLATGGGPSADAIAAAVVAHADFAAVKAATDQFDFTAGNVHAHLVDFEASLDAGDLPTAAEVAAVKAVADAVKLKTDNLPASPAAVGSNMGTATSVTGAVGSVASTVNATLVATGLDAIAVTAPTGLASTFPQMVVQTWRRFFRKATKTTSFVRTYADDGATVVTTQPVTVDGTTETLGAAT